MSDLERLLYRLGIPESKAKLLFEAGILSVDALAFLKPQEISRLLKIDVKDAIRILEEARRASSLLLMNFPEFVTSSRRQYFSTGCKALDKILGGGVPLGALLEIVGEAGSGRTQLAHQLCVTVQLPKERGGLQMKALYVDSEGAFRPERLISIAKRFDLIPRQVLRNVLHVRVLSFAQQYSAIVRSHEFLRYGLGLIVLDSLTSLLRSEYASDLAKRRWALSRLLHALRLMAKEGPAIVLINDVLSDPYTGELRPVGGSILEQMTDVCLFLHKMEGGFRIAELTHAPDLPRGKARFKISAEGIIDYEGDKRSV